MTLPHCAACEIPINQVLPKDISLCDVCEFEGLETLEANNMLTPGETKRLVTMRFSIAKQRAGLNDWYSHKLKKPIPADRYALFQNARNRVLELGEFNHRIVRDSREEYFWVVGRYDAQRLIAAGHVRVHL